MPDDTTESVATATAAIQSLRLQPSNNCNHQITVTIKQPIETLFQLLCYRCTAITKDEEYLGKPCVVFEPYGCWNPPKT